MEVTRQAANNWVREGYSVGSGVLYKILEKFPQISQPWLFDGTGDMLKKDFISNVVSVPAEEDHDGEFTDSFNGAKFFDLKNGKYQMSVPLVPFFAYGKFANDADSLEPDNEGWENESFEVDGIVRGKYFAFEVKGDSMDDESRNSFEEGDRVLARELNNAHWKDGIRYKKYPYWVIVFDSSVLIKQIIDHNMETGEITCHSLNKSPEYCDFKLSLNKVRKLYNVVQKKPKAVNY
ncbi:MAG: XRE family transcriptional regulator [Tannerella sp.]|nr:XRE family transcriptional regulator [Tannerella sp.]